MKDIIILLLSAIIVILIIYKIKLRNRLKDLTLEKDSLKEELNNSEKENLVLKEKYSLIEKEKNECKEENIGLNKEIIKLSTKLENNEILYKEKEKTLENKIQELSNRIFSDTHNFTINSINETLEPIKEDIEKFKQKIEYLSKEEAKEISALMQEIKNIKELNYKLSKEAENLANALTKNSKTQGIFGEIILQKVLENSGLRENIEYKKEVSIGNLRPDIVIYLPDNRHIIIDAKTSMKNYINYIETNDNKYLKELIKNLESHIKNLSKKEYEKLFENELDFIIIFIPIDNVLTLTLNEKPEIFDFALKNNIILSTPTTLITMLKIINRMWKKSYQEKHINDIVKEIENLYDKIALFLEEFNKIEINLNNSLKHYQEAKKRLYTGQGNVIKRLENIKEKSAILPKKTLDK